jgi:hypothetical protein
VDQADRHATFRTYAERWREARLITWAPETRRRVEANIRLHLAPAFDGAMRGISQTDVLLWLARELAAGVPQSSLRLYFELFDTIMAACHGQGDPGQSVRRDPVIAGVSGPKSRAEVGAGRG